MVKIKRQKKHIIFCKIKKILKKCKELILILILIEMKMVLSIMKRNQNLNLIIEKMIIFIVKEDIQ